MSPALFEKYLKQKGLGTWLKWYSSCLASPRPGVQTLVLPKKERKRASVLCTYLKMSKLLPRTQEAGS
jgi:hypothetical protein